MDYKKTLEELEKTLEKLREENKLVPILVEGGKDIAALRKLDLTGTIITVNTGVSLANFCDRLAHQYKKIILLLDWDKKGGFLCGNIVKYLEGRVQYDTRYRELIAKRSMIRTVEGLPSWIDTLREKTRFI
jgi:5S rRNA maturation endonuclease (ribonuclease M5)